MLNPALHPLHMAAPCLVQAAPVIATPLAHVHMLADTHTHTRTNIDNHVKAVTFSFEQSLRSDSWHGLRVVGVVVVVVVVVCVCV